jgi:hypothetical protein
MLTRTPIYLAFASFFVGVAAAWYVFNLLKPTPEQELQNKINSSIQLEVCDRFKEDLTEFKKSPHTFKRSKLSALVSESKAASRALLVDVPDNNPYVFSLPEKKLVDLCRTEANQWVRINSAFPEDYEKELVLITGSHTEGLVTVQSSAPNQAVTRLALVIGNSAYQASPLKNPSKDATDVASFLRSVGFEVIELYDADLNSFRSLSDKFVEKAQRYDVAMFFYSGHGIEINGQNYLVPVDADIQKDEEIPRQAINATDLLRKIEMKRKGTNIFIVDACRNTPIFSSYRSPLKGLGKMDAGSGSLIAFSTAPGQVASDGNGRNSPYTSTLLEELKKPGRTIEEILKSTSRVVSQRSGGRQIPWYNSSLTEDFYFINDSNRK